MPKATESLLWVPVDGQPRAQGRGLMQCER